jgi:hypothetical protein
MSSGLYSGVSGLALGVGLYRGVSGLWSGASGLITGWGGAVSPSLNLNLLAGPLDSRITFSRGSNATMIDGTGRIVYAPANLLTYSQEFDNVAWQKTTQGVGVAPVVTANGATAPDGTNTAESVFFNSVGTATADRSVLRQTVTVAANAQFITSVWLRSATPCIITIAPNLTATGAGFVGGAISANVTTVWQRFQVASTSGTTGGSFIFDIRNNGNDQVSSTVEVWGAQLEPVTYQTTPSTYNSTTATAYYGPRFDAFPVTCLPRGLLLEGARTNLMTQSGAIGTGLWGNTGLGTATQNAAIAPDGTNTAVRINTAAVSSTFGWFQNFTYLATTYTLSAYFKAGTYSFVTLDFTNTRATAAAFDLATGTIIATSGGATATITPAGSGWYRCTVTAALAAGANFPELYLNGSSSALSRIWTPVGTENLFAWGAQLEVGNFVSSYIPTGASTATRNADSAIMTGNNFSSWYSLQSGTLVVGAEPEFSSTTGKPSALLLQSGTPNYHALYVDGPSGTLGYDVASSGVVMDFLASSYSYTPVPALQASLYSSVASQYAVYGQAVTYSNNFFANSANGGPATTDTSGAVPEGLTSMVLGQNDGEYGYGGWFGWLRGVQAYGSASSTATLNQLSDAAGASQRSLSLDFTGEMYYSGTVPFQTPPSFYVGFTVDAYVTED